MRGSAAVAVLLLTSEPAVILRFDHLQRYPRVFRTMTGLTVTEFAALWTDLQPRFQATRRARAHRPGRRREPGGGPHFILDARDQVLTTIVWLRQYPTHEALGFFFGVSDSTARRVLIDVLPILEAAGKDSMRLPDPGKARRKTVDGLLAETPELAVVIDSFEQRVQRPRLPKEAAAGGDQRATAPGGSTTTAADGNTTTTPAASAAKDERHPDTWYSGKKKQHTIKSQVAVDETTGCLADVSDSVPGPTADIKLLQASGLMERLPEGVGALGDLAYVGIDDLHAGAQGATPRRKPRGQPRPEQDVIFNRAFAKRRIVVEHSIRRLRCYQALAQTDRQHRQQHGSRVRAVAGLVNHQIRHRKDS
jgi:DDE superfamily endonuclease